MSSLTYYYYRLLMPDSSTKTRIGCFAHDLEHSVQVMLEKQNNAIVIQLVRLPDWLGTLINMVRQAVAPAIKNDDLRGMLRDMGIMTRSGIPIIEGLHAIAGEKRFGSTSGTQRVAEVLHTELSNGATVTQAFARHSDIFPEVVCNLVAIGDESGNLSEMLVEASNHLGRVAELKSNTKRSMIYPVFVFLAIFGAAGFWIYYVIPNLADLFKQFNAKLPPLTQGVLDFSNWVTAHGAICATVALWVILGPWLCLHYSRRCRKWAYELGHKLPVSGPLLRTTSMAFFTEHLAILVRAGLPLIQSLKILQRATTDEYYKDSIGDAYQTIQRGVRLGVALRMTERFPPLVLRLVLVGEDTGTLDEQLTYLAEEYRMRLEHMIASLSEVIRPLVILLAGGFLIFVIIALLLPVYDLIRQTISMGR